MKQVCVGLLLTLLGSTSLADPAADVKAWNEAFWRAWNAAEVETVAQLFSEDVEIVWAYKEEQASGREALLKLLQWEFSFPSTQVTVKQISEKIYEMGDGSLLVQDHSTQTYPSPDGNPVTELVRATTLYRRVGDRLEVALDHASIAQPWDENDRP